MSAPKLAFNKYFLLLSYATLFCGLLSLLVAGAIGIILALAFALVFLLGWFLEGRKWQLSERLGLALIFLVIPLFFLEWKFPLFPGEREQLAVAALSRLILTLGAIKALQKKADRDWIFLYLIIFFEVLLAAGLSISPLYLGSLILYLIAAVSAIVAFEIKKASDIVAIEKERAGIKEKFGGVFPMKLPVVSFAILAAIGLFAVPLFFFLPRVGGAGMGGGFERINGFVGFSSSVRLGSIGSLQQNTNTVMRIRLDTPAESLPADMKWRGVALDHFDNKSWSQSLKAFTTAISQNERGIYPLDDGNRMLFPVSQTVILEPIDSATIFALDKASHLKGDLGIINLDSERAFTTSSYGRERKSYQVVSDLFRPGAESLQQDRNTTPPGYERYRQLPKMDPRINDQASDIIAKSGAKTRYDKAKAIETYLKNNFTYSLNLKAGGEEPLADFLFNIREGHCEYFASSMAVMLRAQGIETRIVNGFQSGDYNETAGAYIVKQRDAHSWVEVYFPESGRWVSFDPTPPAGLSLLGDESTVAGRLSKYFEAIETFWIQYFISYDNQEQKSLFQSLRSSMFSYQVKISYFLGEFRDDLDRWWNEVKGEKGIGASAWAIGTGFLYFSISAISLWALYKTMMKLASIGILAQIASLFGSSQSENTIAFYMRMQSALEKRGFKRQPGQTPLEFAFETGIPEAVKVTESYNRVRFGGSGLTIGENSQIESWLKSLEEGLQDQNIA